MTAWGEDRDLDTVLVQRYCAETASVEEAARIEEWFRGHPEQREWYEQLKAALRTRELPVMPAEERSAALAEVVRKALARRPEGGGRGAARSDRRGGVGAKSAGWGGFQRHPLRAMLGFTGTVVLGIAVLLAVLRVGPRHMGDRPAPSMMTYTTGNGERATITLPDGGVVALNVASRLDVPLDYMAGNHTVRLVGEGLFTVLHHDRTPLTVLAGPTTTRVLGTSFVVRRYAADTTTLVAVRDGKVTTGKATVVSAHQMVVVGRSKMPQVGSWDPSVFTFATGVLTIDGLPLPAAVVELDRWFDADIRLGDPALATHFVEGSFARGSLGDLAEILESTFNVRVVRDGRVLTLYPKR